MYIYNTETKTLEPGTGYLLNKNRMANITINNEEFHGKDVNINDGTVSIDGNEETVDLSNGIDIQMESEGEEQNVNVNAKSNGTTIKVRQTSKTGKNSMKISF